MKLGEMSSVLNVVNTFARLSACSVTGPRNITTCAYPLYFQATNILLGEPLKKKKRLDPNIVRAREERKKKKLEKQIRRMEKNSKQLKPLFEVEISPELSSREKELSRQVMPLSTEETERRALLEKEWNRYKQEQWINNVRVIESIVLSQEKALKELRAASEQLYKKAVEFDDSILPYNTIGPVHTPPINNYDSPDGEYIDITLKYEGET